MKASTVVILGVAVALAIGISSTLAYAQMWNPYGYGQNAQNPGPWYGGYSPRMGGYQGYPGGMMGGNYGYPAGMMGQWFSGRGAMGPGMMYGSSIQGQCANCPRNYNYSWNVGGNSAVIRIVNYGFYPNAVTVAKGTTMTWINMDGVTHTVTSGSEATPTSLFDSHELGHMQSFSFTFETPGAYTYFCDLHPGMTGTITVTP